ncbi:hypothetical protein SLE2022_189450 [Rubroshorea leprosula]
MFTPQRKVWAGWSPTPHKKGDGSASNGVKDGTGGGRGKELALAEPVTPIGVGSDEPDGLPEKVSRLENELFEYQYNMGLLLIEKKEWTSKYGELNQTLLEAKEALKREELAHSMAMEDVQEREEKLKKALGVEKQCVLNLEKALRDIRSELAETKFTADSKLSEANSLIASVEEKSLEVEVKLRAADARLAEVSRKSSEIERKSQELESRENALRRERLSFIAEQETHESSLLKQREDLVEWERKLKDGEERLAKGQRIVSQREERANENDRIFKQKEKSLEEIQKKIDAANLTLKEKEDNINNRLSNLTLLEKESDDLRKKLELKEKELLALEEKLNDREKVEIQKLVNEHNAILDQKQLEFELEIEQKRKALDADLKSRVIEVEKKGAEINHKEEKVAKREQALDKRLDKVKEKEKEYELKLKALKEREKAIKIEEKNLETERKQLLAEKEDHFSLKAEVEKIRAENEEQLLKISEENVRLRVTEEERSEYLRLQSELKAEIEKCRHQEELLLKETEDLRQQKENFEREWEELDGKRAEIEKEEKSFSEQQEKFEKEKHTEEERLKSEKQVAEEYIKRELGALEVAKESFAASMEHERSVMAEKAENERSQMLHDLELQKRKLESDLQSKHEEMEKELQERKKLLEEEKERNLDDINYLREAVRREMEETKQEILKIQKERQEIDASKTHLEGQQIEIRKDIDDLVELSKRLKDQRERLITERSRFISFVEKQKSCNNCSEIISEFMLSDLQSLQEIDNADVLPLPRLADDYVNARAHGNLAGSGRQQGEMSLAVDSGSPLSGGTMSWLRKCTSKIFKLSPGKKDDSHHVKNLKEDFLSGEQVEEEASKRLGSTDNGQELSFAIVDESFDAQKAKSDTSMRHVDTPKDQSTDDQSNINIKAAEDPGNGQPSNLNSGQQPRKRGRPRVNRTRSVKAVVQDAKAVLGEAGHPNGIAEDSDNVDRESRDESSLAGRGTSRNARKRNHAQTSQFTLSEQAGDDSEGISDSVTAGKRRNTRQKVVVALESPGQKRYNLRRPKGGVKVAKASSDSNRENRGLAGDQVNENGGSRNVPQSEAQDGDPDSTKKLVETVAFSEVDGTLEGIGEYVEGDYHSESRTDGAGGDEDDSGDEDDEEEESEHPGEASIGKKLWKFFTT